MALWIIPKQKSVAPDLRAAALDHQSRAATKRLRAQVKDRLAFEQSAQFKARLIAEQEAREHAERLNVEAIERSKEDRLKRIEQGEQARLRAERARLEVDEMTERKVEKAARGVEKERLRAAKAAARKVEKVAREVEEERLRAAKAAARKLIKAKAERSAKRARGTLKRSKLSIAVLPQSVEEERIQAIEAISIATPANADEYAAIVARAVEAQKGALCALAIPGRLKFAKISS